MKIEKIDSKLTDKVRTKIESISSFDKENKFGTYSTIIVLHTKDGNFSNYKNVFEHQNIDVEKLSPNDEVDILYNVYVNKVGKEFKNFVKVDIVE